MRFRYWLLKILTVLIIVLSLVFSLLLFINTSAISRNVLQTDFMHQLYSTRDLLINQFSSIPPVLKPEKQSEIDQKHYRELLSLAKDWRESALEPGAVYLVWRNSMMIPLTENRGNLIAQNKAFVARFRQQIVSNPQKVKFSILSSGISCYAVRTSKGYFVKLVPNAPPEYHSDPWSAVLAVATKTVHKNGILYLVFQNENGVLFNYPKKLPAVVPLDFPTGDSLVVYGDIAETNGPLKNLNCILRIGFDSSPLKERETLLTDELTRRFILFFAIVLIMIVLLILLRRRSGKPGKMENAILNQSTEALMVFDPRGALLYANRMANELFDEKSGPLTKNAFAKIGPLEKNLKENQDFHDFELTEKQKKWRFSGKPVVAGKNETYYLLLGQDVSYLSEVSLRRQMENRLNAMNVLASGIAHEIRNPLNSISMIFQRLRYEYQPQTEDDEYQQLTKTLSGEITRLDLLINQFLSLTRPLKIKLSRVPVKKLLAEIELMAEANTKEANIALHLSVEPEDLELTSDPDLLKQVLINLIRNAADAIGDKDGGTITLVAKKDAAEIVFSVSDNGSGMSEKTREEILNPFYTTKSKGSGLGLSIVQRILTQLEGTLTVNSVENIGSEFAFRFQVEE